MSKHRLTKKQKEKLMGKKIVVDKKFFIERTFGKRIIKEHTLKIQKKGWIAGFTYIKSGSIDSCDDCSSFNVCTTYPCINIIVSTAGTIIKVPISVLDNII